MIIPPEITYRNIEKHESIDELIRERVAKLERYCDHISSCRVAIENRHRDFRSGKPYRVRIDIRVPPGHDVVVSKDSAKGGFRDELLVVIRDAFDTAERKLKRIVEKQRGDVKVHSDQETGGYVERLFREQGYGFIKSLEGREIYFHKNSVIQNDFERLEIGTGVRYVETTGEEGPQASTVQIVDKPGVRRNRA
ncbi:MAG: HPF/RaiA family ribosome-associated protein [Desulfobacterales bacterium]